MLCYKQFSYGFYKPQEHTNFLFFEICFPVKRTGPRASPVKGMHFTTDQPEISENSPSSSVLTTYLKWLLFKNK